MTFMKTICSSSWVPMKQHECKTRCSIFDKHSPEPSVWLLPNTLISTWLRRWTRHLPLERFWAFLEWQEEDIPNCCPFIFLCFDKGWPLLTWVVLSGEIPAKRCYSCFLFTADSPTDSSATRNHPPFSLLLWSSNLKLRSFQTENYLNGRNQSSSYWGYDSELVRCT